MQTRDHGHEFVVQDSPGLHRLLGLFFFAIGAIFVLGPLGLFTNAESVGGFARSASVLMGCAGVGTGLWILLRSPRSRLVLDRAIGRVRITRQGLGPRQVLEWPASDISAIAIREEKDTDGDPTFQVHIVLHDGASVPVSLLWTHGHDAALGWAESLAEALRVPLAP